VTADQQPPVITARPAPSHDATQRYEIRVAGTLASRWSAWLGGLTVESDPTDGTTVISGPVVDQAALHGLLQRLRDVGIPLLALNRIPPNTHRADSSDEPEGELT
jgi:hypothetical protein